MNLKSIAIATAAVFFLMMTGCETPHSKPGHQHSSGTHTMGNPKSSYQMSNEDMPAPGSRSSGSTQSGGTHRMGTPKENYQMSNENMKKQ